MDKSRHFTVLMLCICIFGCQQSKTRTLVGVWQDYNEMASGWTNTFQFFPDKRFAFHINSMDCASRDRGYSGTWEIKGENLILDISSEQVIVGGKVVDAMGSCATEKDIDGGKPVTKAVSPDRTEKKKISIIKIDRSSNKMEMVEIDGKKYWKFENDPSKYD